MHIQTIEWWKKTKKEQQKNLEHSQRDLKYDVQVNLYPLDSNSVVISNSSPFWLNIYSFAEFSLHFWESICLLCTNWPEDESKKRKTIDELNLQCPILKCWALNSPKLRFSFSSDVLFNFPFSEYNDTNLWWKRMVKGREVVNLLKLNRFICRCKQQQLQP